MPFADDVRKYTFASLENLVSKRGEKITKHPYLPTEEQLEAMDRFIDAMDVMDAGERDDEGCVPDTTLAYLALLSQYLTETASRGTTPSCRIIPPSIARNRHFSTAQS
jgi:hypothetical protein